MKKDRFSENLLFILVIGLLAGQVYWVRTVNDLRAENTELKLLLGYTDQK